MSLLARQFVFIPGDKILASEWNAELDQLYRLLSGSLSGQLILKQNSQNVVAILQNSRVGQVVLDLQQNSVSKLKILGTQQLQSLVTGIAPFEVASTTKVAGLNAEFLDGLTDGAFVLINTKHTEYYIPFCFDSPVVGSRAYSYIVPAGTNMSLINVGWNAVPGLGADGTGVTTISLRKNGVVLVTRQFDSDGNTAQDILATSVVENDVISVTIDSVVLPGIEDLLVRVKFKQDLNT